MAEPIVDSETLEQAERLAGLGFDAPQREMMLLDIDRQLQWGAALRSQQLHNSLAPAEVFDPRPAGFQMPVAVPRRDPASPAKPLPDAAQDIAFASLAQLGVWLRSGALSSLALTRLYLERIEQHAPRLQCVVTVARDHALAQAARADAEIAAGHYRGPLHGVPWMAKDLLDTAGITTSWGAEPYAERVPATDAKVVRLLNAAGAVLIAKATLGALASGDIWHGGRTRNPWNVEEGSGGSSAGSAAAVAAGLCGFAIGSETLGSIISPCMRCGASGLRPTFGRVSRSGAMALCWSLDKLGPICRTVADTALVLDAINAYDAADPGSIGAAFNFDAAVPVQGLRVGYSSKWFDDPRADPLDREALRHLCDAGAIAVEITLPDLPYDALWTILSVEAASAFDELTVSGRAALLARQDAAAWPNLFRLARLIPAVDFVNAQRFRRTVMTTMDDVFRDVDAIVGPSFAGPMQTITNLTGHPALTLRTGLVERGSRVGIPAIGALGNMAPSTTGATHRVPHGITVWGRLFDEGSLLRLGVELEKRFDVWRLRPPQEQG